MTKKQYLKRMEYLKTSFDIVQMKLTRATNEYLTHCDNDKMEHDIINDTDLHYINNLCCELALTGAWIQDRLEGKYPKSKGSMTKKIRKALGYSYP